MSSTEKSRGASADTRPDQLIASGDRAAALAFVADALASVGVTGVVLAARGGEVLFARSIAAADPNDPLTANTLLEIGSVSKQFVATAMVLLHERGRVNLDASIGEYLDGVPQHSRGVTLRHLLNHTSGLHSAGKVESLQEYLAACLGDGPKHPPGTHFEYNDSAYSLAGGLIEKVSGVSFTQFVASELYRPARMKTASFTGDPLPPGTTQAIGRSGGGQSRMALDHPYGDFKWYNGMGGGVMNVWDLWAWDRALARSIILSDRGKKELFTPGLSSYALGWFVEAQEGRLSYTHSGGVRGFKAMAALYPADDGALFVLANHDRLNPRGFAGLFEQVLFDRQPQLPPRLLGKALQEAVTGHFVDASGAEWEFEADGPVTYAYRYQDGKRAPYWTSSGYVGLTDDGSLVVHEWQSPGFVPQMISEAVQIPMHVSQGADGTVQLRIGEHEAKRRATPSPEVA